MATEAKKAARPESEIDELGRIQEELDAAYLKLAVKAARVAELKALVLARYAKSPAAREFLAEGAHFAVHVSARSMQREVVMAKAVKLLGADLAKICVLPLGVLERHLGPRVIGRCVTSARTGPRSLRVVAKGSH